MFPQMNSRSPHQRKHYRESPTEGQLETAAGGALHKEPWAYLVFNEKRSATIAEVNSGPLLRG